MAAPTPAVQAEPLGATSTGLPPRVAACLAYSMWWLSGALVLAIERRNRFVRFHAAQAVAGFGLLWTCGVAVWSLSFLMAFVSPLAFRVTAVIGPLFWAGAVAAWAWCVWQAARGEAWRMPWVGAWADARAARRADAGDITGR